MVQRQEHWMVFPGRVNDAVAMFMVDVAWGSRLPVESMPVLIDVQVDLAEPREDGLTTAEESARLNEVEDKLVDALAWANQAVLVGRMVSQGRRVWFFYGASAAKAAEIARDAVGDAPYDPLVRSRADEDWTWYQEFLYPNPAQLRWASDAEVVEQLTGYGDSLSVPRKVTHYIYFTDLPTREAYATWAASRGYDIDDRPTGEGERPFGLILSHVGPVDVDSINTKTGELSAKAEEHGGDYDGWETQVVGGEEPPSPAK